MLTGRFEPAAAENLAGFIQRRRRRKVHFAHNEAVRQIALLDQIDQLLLEFGDRAGFTRPNQQIRGSGNFGAEISRQPRAPVGFAVAADRLARAQKIFQNAFLDERYGPFRDTLVVHFLVAEEGLRRVIGNVKHFRHDAHAAPAFEIRRGDLRDSPPLPAPASLSATGLREMCRFRPSTSAIICAEATPSKRTGPV